MLRGALASGYGRLSFAVGLAVLVMYVLVEARGIVFGGTDARPSSASSSVFGGSSGGRSSSGWGYSGGYHGGK